MVGFVLAEWTTPIAALAVAVIVIRVLSQTQFGVWSYSFNVLQMFLLLNGLGAPSAILRYCAAHPERRLAYWTAGARIALAANGALAVSMIVFISVLPERIEGSRFIVLCLAALPLISVLPECGRVYLHARGRSLLAGIIRVSNNLGTAVAVAILVLVAGMPGLIAAHYIGPASAIIVALMLLRAGPLLQGIREAHPTRREAVQVLTFGSVCVLGDGLSALLVVADSFLVGLITASPEQVALYRAAAMLPLGALAVPKGIASFYTPRWAAAGQDPKEWHRRVWITIARIGVLNTMIALALVLAAPTLIIFLFGPQYAEATGPFRLLCTAFLLAGTFRATAGEALFALGKISYNVLNVIVSGLVQLILNWLLVPEHLAWGAAWATLGGAAASSVIGVAGLVLTRKRAPNIVPPASVP